MILSIGVIFPSLGMFPIIMPISNYLLTFIVGMYVARMQYSTFGKIKLIDIAIAFILLSIIRFISNMTCIIDTVLCITIAIFFYKVRLNNWCYMILAQLGKHSQNIFLFHTFIFYYWFREVTYASHNPLIIFIQLIVVCYLISEIIEFVKKKIGFYKLVNK